MATFEHKPMSWSGDNAIQPGEIASTGYAAGDSPAAEHENYFRHQTGACITELQSVLATLDGQVQYLQGVASTAMDRLNTLEFTTVPGIQSKLDTLENTTIPGIQNALNELQTNTANDIKVLKEENEKLKTQIVTLEQRIEALGG